MSDRRRGLGRGLGALIPQAAVKTSDANARGAAAPAFSRSPVDVLIPERTALDGWSGGQSESPATPSSETISDPSAPATPEPTADSFECAEEPGRSGADATEQTTSADDHPRNAAEHNQMDTSANGDVTEAAELSGPHFAEIPVELITPNPRQPRQVFDEESMAELVHSIREVGLLQPVILRPRSDGRYELVVGERRWRAGMSAGLSSIPAIVRETRDADMLRDALLENLHRSELNPLEEAAAYDQLLHEFGCTHEELAQRVGRSRPQISNTLRLLKLPPLVQRRVAAGVLSAGHARALMAMDDPTAQERLAQRVVAEGLSVRAVEEIVAIGAAPQGPPQRRQSRKPEAPGMEELAARLADHFETRVRVNLGRNKGRIVVEFASLDDLDRILTLMAPGATVGAQGRGRGSSDPGSPSELSIGGDVGDLGDLGAESTGHVDAGAPRAEVVRPVEKGNDLSYSDRPAGCDKFSLHDDDRAYDHRSYEPGHGADTATPTSV